MRRPAITLAVCVLLTLGARQAAAQGQPWTDRGYVNVNLGFETTSGDLNDATTFRLYDEDATLSVNQAIDSGVLFDISGGARVWRNVSVGLGFHVESTHGEAAIQGSIPNPLFTDRPRAIADSVGDLGRTESAVHLQFGYMFPVNDAVSVQFFAGPSFFRVTQDVVSGVSVTETSFPFSTVNAQTTITERKDTPVGFNIGADVTYIVIETGRSNVGVGAFLRYAGASADLSVFEGHVFDSDVGGLQLGFGARIRF